MIVLADTHLLLWAAADDPRLSNAARDVLENPAVDVLFSAASIWEVGIKTALGRRDFAVDARLFRRSLLDNGYDELAITGAHSIEAAGLPPLHGDPFDRMLVGQVRVEGCVLLTADTRVAEYGSPVRRV